MIQPTPTSTAPRQPPIKQPFRAVLERAFALWALAATFFGLAMLIVFFVVLTRDVVQWFRKTPEHIELRNQELHRRLEAANNSETDIAKRLSLIDEEMKAELAKGGAQEQELRARYEHVKERERANLRQLHEEWKRSEQELRTDTSPPALVQHFFTHGPSHIPQDAGILPALLGSLFLSVLTVLFAVPLGVGAAIYLEEYRGSGRLAQLIQININNLAGVPSVMFGILGAYLFVELIFKPLESPRIAARNVLGGGLTLALLTLPVVIVSAQEALRAVPSSLRQAAFALGATHWQVIWQVVLPSALPGILTGVILALSRALGEAAPLVLFGALLFVSHNPDLFSRFTVLPMQIFGWAERPAEVWRYNAAVASAVLVLMLLALNATAIYLRQRARQQAKR
jgi:phosphate transport system permease protein